VIDDIADMLYSFGAMPVKWAKCPLN